MTLTDQVRAALADLEELHPRHGGAFSVADVVRALCIKTTRDKNRAKAALAAMEKRGEVARRHREGLDVYELVEVETPEIKAAWKVARAKRTFTIDDLVELATGPPPVEDVAAGPGTLARTKSHFSQAVKRWVRDGHVAALGKGKYRLVSDAVKPPPDSVLREQLRLLREQRRKAGALDKLDQAARLIHEARMDISDINHEGTKGK